MEQSNKQSARETINVRESGFLVKSEILEEIRPWHVDTRPEQTDNDGSDNNYDQE